MAFLNKVKNLFRSAPLEKKLPSYVLDSVNPKEHWDIIGELGDGAFGKVEKAVSKTDPRQFAASKSIEIQDGEEIEDFLVEIEILQKCRNHPVILKLFSTYFFDNRLTMMLEFCGGGAVDNLMLELEKPLNEVQVKYIAFHVLDALKYIHEQNVIHRDLKAGNILLTNDAQVRLADFGVSANLKNEREKRDTFIGTPYWMAPEVMMCETFKDQPYDCISDIWSFGITLIEMVLGEPPHSEVSPMRVLIKVQKSPPPTLEPSANYSNDFRDFLAKCLVKNPAERLSANSLFSHDWLKAANNGRKSVLQLIAEMKAVDVKEEIICQEIMEDDDSVAGSDEISSQRPGNDTWSSASDSPLPHVTEHFKPPLSPMIQTPPPIIETPHKKRAAPPPPKEEADTNGNLPEQTVILEFSIESNGNDETADAVFTTPEKNKGISTNLNAARIKKEESKDNLTLNTSPRLPAKNTTLVMSPRREALNILDDLNITLEDEQGSLSSSYFEIPPEPVSPPTPLKVDHTIRDVIKANRKKSTDSLTLPTSSTQSLDGSFEKSQANQSISTNIPPKVNEKISFNTSLNNSMVTIEESIDEMAEYDGDITQNSSQSLSVQHILQQKLKEKASIDISVSNTPPMVNKSPLVVASTQDAYFEPTSSKKSSIEEKTPPPEPPVDYDGNAKENKKPVPQTASPISKPKAKSASEKPLGERKDVVRKTITRKTRTYMIDGIQVTSTTIHVLGAKDDKVQRKQQLHDLRRLQRDEARQKQELHAEGLKLVEEQAKKFGLEQQNLSRTSDLEMDAMERRQRREIEDTEAQQENELRITQKRLKVEQEKDMRAFKERLKQEMKIFKQEVTMLSKTQRKDALKQRKDQIEIEHQLKEKDFLMQLQQNGDSMLQRLADKHKERMAAMEKQFLMQKHNLLRAKENNVWELEDKHMREKFVLHRKLFKDEYYLLRTQMLARHQREMSQIEKLHQEEEDILIRALTNDRKKLPKMLRSETKTRSIMFKESLRISMANMSNAEMQERIRRFDEQEALRMRAALEEHDAKSQKKLQMLKDRQQEAIIELDEMQNEKRKQLLEKERNTMNEHEGKYHEARNVWQENLITRKTVLEEKFQDELSKQEMFYGVPYSASQASTLSGRHMP
ncbi:unnamed protein product [Caenorhabditis angaria]|uniref:Protein kinase domain-containing protein n=1 Tax=Caenorhabditis angaria TaxID=860376 RepID=A0A9P1J131_9PELO|nr:unnamed protein product [Caenorhabditis angaria]